MAVQFLRGLLSLLVLPFVAGEAAGLGTDRGRVRVVGLVVCHGWVSSTVRVTAVESWKPRVMRFGFAEGQRLGGIGSAIAMGDRVKVL